MRKKILISISIIFIFSAFFSLASAQEGGEIEYGNNPVLDNDLDGLTDEGENRIFRTDPNNPDTDGDGILDGSEILGKTDPLDISDPSAKEVTYFENSAEESIPWSWYIARVSGLLGFLMLYFSFLFGLTIRTPGLKKLLSPADSLSAHGWISIQALVFSFAHALALSFDKFVNFSLKDVFIPFALEPNEMIAASGVTTELVALGIISFYLMLVLTATSYLRKFINQKVWRALHFLNIVLYVFVAVHALYLGTDLKSGLAREIFIGANILLGFLIAFNLIWRVASAIRKKAEEKNENLRQSNSAIFPNGNSQNFRRGI